MNLSLEVKEWIVHDKLYYRVLIPSRLAQKLKLKKGDKLNLILTSIENNGIERGLVETKLDA